mmetsp:Transcript_30074/g.53317  ORF Transcript_30074/g.53317 Transcript_30074/m.53317 type:complete len:278 (-) Transcript_30074:1061-1894(-)
MGTCNCRETDRKRLKLTLESETFSEQSVDFNQSNLEPQKLTAFLVTKLKPELKRRSVAFVPPITKKLVETIRRGQRVSIGVMVKDTKKLRIKCLSSSKLDSKVIFVESTQTIAQVLELLSLNPSADVVFENVCLPRDLQLSRLPKSVVTLTVLTHGRNDWQANRISQDLVVWKITGPGLNFEGECTNQNCCAYSQMVFMQKGLGSFLLQAENLKVNPCPMCQRATNLRSFGVSFCSYRFQSPAFKDCQVGMVETEYLGLCKFEDLGLNEVKVETNRI